MLDLFEDNFHENVIEAEKPVLVDFWASWCGYCTKMLPVLAEFSAEMQDKVIIGKVDVEKNRQIAQKYGVMNLPTMLLFKNGEIVEKLIGYTPKDDLISKVMPHV